MNVKTLLTRLPGAHVSGDDTQEVTGIAVDSREVRAGYLFAALVGFNVDGHDFVPAAIAAGARVILAEQPRPETLPDTVTWIRVSDSRMALGPVSEVFWDCPGDDLILMAITGTNGKTTTAWILDQIMRQAGHQPGLLCTIEQRFGGVQRPSIMTTPMAHDLQRLLAEIRSNGCSHAILEASSHGLELGRLAHMKVAVAGFTNLSRDHMDFHESMDSYKAAKARLFTHHAQKACFHVGDPVGLDFAKNYAGQCMTVGAENADLHVVNLQCDLEGATGELITEHGSHPIAVPFPGRHNVENALVALGMAQLAGVPLTEGLTYLANCVGAPGRLERVPGSQRVLVDYAHTPDALYRVLKSLRTLTDGRLLCVFGAGGNRDPGKRPEMGAAVASVAEVGIVTSDNPRNEDPHAIIADIVEGMRQIKETKHTLHVVVEPDRRNAIAQALSMAGPEDIVLVAGKGHEPYQVIGDQVLNFDDRQVAAELMAAGGLN